MSKNIKGKAAKEWSVSLGFYPGILIGARTYHGDTHTQHVFYLPFIDIAFDNLKDLPEINKLYMELFPEGSRPARTIYQAEALPFGGKIKITGTAVKDIL